MAIETTYGNLHNKLSCILDKVIEDQEVIIVRRKGSKDFALVPAAELSGLVETAYLLRSPRNAQRRSVATCKVQA
jgi:antitoxin YefM